ncbi:hypothetical protein [Caldimonas brevitalea]|uniref:Uncharacterized protein n=1 Tax=Caldimonas brevitalea TaxID=413882 RepID=A0A0G3BR80_9BURK|nr:hypothetical protein [Caldimonas brevitalea]AKJ30498.1 hypothetical protein AAW51_3807 [Caldimonas brevitalea]
MKPRWVRASAFWFTLFFAALGQLKARCLPSAQGLALALVIGMVGLAVVLRRRGVPLQFGLSTRLLLLPVLGSLVAAMYVEVTALVHTLGGWWGERWLVDQLWLRSGALIGGYVGVVYGVAVAVLFRRPCWLLASMYAGYAALVLVVLLWAVGESIPAFWVTELLWMVVVTVSVAVAVARWLERPPAQRLLSPASSPSA